MLKITKVNFIIGSVVWIVGTIGLAFLLSKNVFPAEYIEDGFFVDETKTKFNSLLFLSLILFAALANLLYFLALNRPRFNYLRADLGKRLLVLLLLEISIGLFCLGLNYPLFEAKNYFLFKKGASIISSIKELMNADEVFLALLILVFTIVFPLLKFTLVTYCTFVKDSLSKKMKNLVSAVGKWSMLDVFILAIVIVNLRSNNMVFEVTSQKGVYFFSLSVILSIVATVLLLKVEDHGTRIEEKVKTDQPAPLENRGKIKISNLRSKN